MPAWFVGVTYVSQILDNRLLLVDSRLYQQATNAWLAGGDPWLVNFDRIYYAAGPWSLVAYLPTSWLPLEAAAWGWAGVGVAAAVWTLRRLEMPLWWLAFPPLAMAIWNGNAQPVVLAALLVRAPWGVTVAGALKLYGFVPAILARRWLELAIAAIAFLIALPLLPWELWASHRFGFESATALTWNGSAYRFWPLLPFAIAALWILRRRGAEWLAIPAVWPGTQFFYTVFALPALRDKPWLAMALALPFPLLPPIAIIVSAAVSLKRGRRDRFTAARPPPRRGSTG
jgi:hypothetical protein